MKTTQIASLLATVVLFGSAVANAQNDYKKSVKDQYSVHVFKPGQVAATDAQVARLKAPAGFRVTKFVQNLGNPPHAGRGTQRRRVRFRPD